MEETNEDVVLDDSNVNTEEEKDQGSLNYDVDVSLEEDEEQSIISKLMEDNPGKEEDELSEQIEEMKSKTLEGQKKRISGN
jgi:hypothetical protein